MKLNEKQKVFTVAGVFVVLVGGVGALNFLKFRERTSIIDQIDKFQGVEQLAKARIRLIPGLLQERSELASNIRRYAEILPQEEHVQHEVFVNTIDNYRRDTKILIRKADYVQIKSTRKGDEKRQASFVRHRYRFSLLGTVPDFIDFLNKIENHARFLKVDSFRIKPTKGGDDVREVKDPDARELASATNPVKEIELTISTYTYLKGAGEGNQS